MRYLIAMVFAVIGAGLAAVFLSSQVADWVVSHQSFDSPDDADSMHMAVYMASNVGGLIIGWLLGWIIGGVASTGKQPT
jgi:membrane associated rhomboid family serine protease